MAAGLVLLIVGLERLVSAVLFDGLSPLMSKRFVVAAACGIVGVALVIAAAVAPRRQQ
jgi:hypothetical protein